MFEITIQRNVPIPPFEGHSVYPTKGLKVGESYFIPDPKKIASIRGNVYALKRRNPASNFIVRTVTEKKVKGIRVWRTA